MIDEIDLEEWLKPVPGLKELMENSRRSVIRIKKVYGFWWVIRRGTRTCFNDFEYACRFAKYLWLKDQ